MRLRKIENFPVRGKFSEADSGFKGTLQDKPMQEILVTMDNGLCKVPQDSEVVLLIDPNAIRKNIMLDITSH